MRTIELTTPFSTLTSSVLAAMNIADRYYKAEASTDGLRMQIKDYAEECSRLRTEVARLKRELGRK